MPANRTVRQTAVLRPQGHRKETSRVGKRGAIVVPARMRRKFGIEIYTPTRIAEFLLCNAVSAKDYRAAVRAVRKLGIDPRTIAHE